MWDKSAYLFLAHFQLNEMHFEYGHIHIREWRMCLRMFACGLYTKLLLSLYKTSLFRAPFQHRADIFLSEVRL